MVVVPRVVPSAAQPAMWFAVPLVEIACGIALPLFVVVAIVPEALMPVKVVVVVTCEED